MPVRIVARLGLHDATLANPWENRGPLAARFSMFGALPFWSP